MKTIFYNAHLVDKFTNTPGAILVKDGVIFAIIHGNFEDADSARNLVKLFDSSKNCSDKCASFDETCAIEFINCGGKTLMPSFIDMHVHFRYPGQAQKEDLDSGTMAAISGGFGCVVLMPNTTPVVSSSQMAHSIENEANSFKRVKVIQAVSITKDFDGVTTNHIDDLEGASVITEDGNDVSSSSVMLDAMCKAAVKGIIVSCHCEDASFRGEVKSLREKALFHYGKYDKFMQSAKNTENAEIEKLNAETFMENANELLSLSEDLATHRNIEIAKNANCKIHLAHVSTAKSILEVAMAKAEFSHKNLPCPITVEVTPHHFALNTQNRENFRLIVNPPIRSANDQNALLEAVRCGTVDVISTDHAPHTLDDKLHGSPGFPGLETAFAVTNTFLVQKKIIDIKRLSALMSANPSHILGLDNEKTDCALGLLKAGFCANLVLVDTAEKWTVDSTKFHTKGKMCPFENMELTGKVLNTWFCGKKVF